MTVFTKNSHSTVIQCDMLMKNEDIPLKKVVYFTVFLIFIMLPVYVFPSGLVQPVDALILMVFLYTILTINKMEVSLITPLLISFFLFTAWALIINMGYFFSTYDSYLLLASSHLIYVFLFLLCFSILFYRLLSFNGSIIFLLTIILFSLFVPLILNKGQDIFSLKVRHTLSFNNPNQLAYFSGLMWAITLSLHRFYLSTSRNRLINVLMILIFILSHFLMLLSASRAGIVSIILMDMIFIYSRSKKLLWISVFPLLVLLVLNYQSFSSSYQGFVEQYKDTAIISRLLYSDIQKKLDERTERLKEIKGIKMIIGKGKSRKEVSLTRAWGHKKPEIHNTLIDTFYSYGVVGLIMFCIFLAFYLKSLTWNKYNLALFLSLFPFHISHNLIRFRLMWLFMAVLYGIYMIQFNCNKKGIT